MLPERLKGVSMPSNLSLEPYQIELTSSICFIALPIMQLQARMMEILGKKLVTGFYRGTDLPMNILATSKEVSLPQKAFSWTTTYYDHVASIPEREGTQG